MVRLPPPREMPAIAVVGSMMIDQITYCTRVPEEGETLVAERYEQGFGGKGANQAVMAARLGATVHLVGCVGEDDLGRATVANLEANGVDASSVTAVVGLATGVAPIWVDANGANRILIAVGANGALGADAVHDALEARRVAAVLAQLETPQEAAIAAFRLARQRGAVTLLNPAPAAAIDPALLAETDWLIPNENEHAELFGTAPDAEAIAAGAAHRRYGLVVTLGAAGALVSHGGTTTLIDTPVVDKVVDTTGAGDAFVGAFATGVAAGLDPVEAARLGCVAGSLAVGAAGTQTSFPSRPYVEDALNNINREG